MKKVILILFVLISGAMLYQSFAAKKKMLSEYTLKEIAELPQSKRDNLMNYLYYKSKVDGEFYKDVLSETTLEYAIKSGATLPKIQAP